MPYDYKTSLPSEARRHLTDHLFGKLRDAKLNIYADPVYDYVAATSEVEGEFANNILYECMEEARARYERVYPKEWDNANRKMIRRRLPV